MENNILSENDILFENNELPHAIEVNEENNIQIAIHIPNNQPLSPEILVGNNRYALYNFCIVLPYALILCVLITYYCL
jgi:hypothetical protein